MAHLKNRARRFAAFGYLINTYGKFVNTKKVAEPLFLLAAGLGFEPRQSDPESLVLPLHNPAKIKDSGNYNTV